MKAGEVEIGSLVMLEIGGPTMLVVGVVGYEGGWDRFKCVWFDNTNRLQEYYFNRKLLVLQ